MLKVVCFCSYLADCYPPPGTHKNVYDACGFIQAIKAEKPLRMYATVPVRGKRRTLKQENRDDAIRWFGWLASDWIEQDDDFPGPVILVPIPNSAGTIGSRTPTRSVSLASAIWERPTDVLRWKKNLGKAHQTAGKRDPRPYYNNLALVGELRSDANVVLVDDVMTSGAHLQAAAALLRRRGAEVVGAVCAGRRVVANDLPADCFEPVIESLQDFSP